MESQQIDPLREKMLRDYAWAYFAFHADQRMKTFNFFLIIAGLMTGGITSLLKADGDSRWIWQLGLSLSILSLVFWKLDQRNKMLVRNGEAALKFLDSLHNHPDECGVPHVLRIFDRDDHYTKSATAFPLDSGHFGYSKCLGLIFSIFTALGLLFVGIGLSSAGPQPQHAGSQSMSHTSQPK
jgi:hypothetical protein